ncbi:hypothetical protein OHA72_34065 [Dactylosporangium sp. NBC_01737]|uniref:hypothetical protein n=1 Tax=Dactylosporangium sp. NBC_01737 TaxID=2975959 RepID=UPI002E0D8506|nr:hypothetical protein OHA72_34065 [Dactylosporangium sp. NBC_01737]
MSSIHAVACPGALRSSSRSSAVGHTPSTSWSHAVHGSAGRSDPAASGVGARATNRASSAAKQSAAPDTPVAAAAGVVRPPGTYRSALTARPSRTTGPASGSGAGKPAVHSARCTVAHAARRGESGRAFTVTERPSASRTPYTRDRCPAVRNTSPTGLPSVRSHQGPTSNVMGDRPGVSRDGPC